MADARALSASASFFSKYRTAMVAAVLAVPLCFSDYVVYVTGLVVVAAIAILGLSYIIRNTGQVSIGHGAIQAIGAYAAAIAVTRWHAPFLLALLIGAFMAWLFGLILALPSVRLDGPYFAVITLVFNWAISESLLLYPQVTGGFTGLFIEQFSLLRSPTYTLYIIAALMLLGCMWVVDNLQVSTIGRSFLLIKRSVPAAMVVGMDTARCKVAAVSLGNVLVGISGVLYLFLVSDVTPDAFGFSQSAYFLVGSVTGGMSSGVGALVGASIVTLFPQMFSELKYLAPIALGCILIITLILAPDGVINLRRKSLRRRARGRRLPR